MAATKHDALATASEVALAVMDPDMALDLEAIKEELGADAASLGMALFTRVKMPAGGGRAYEIEDADDPENPEVVSSIEGVVIAHHSVNAYWKTKMEDGGDAAPDCSSKDGVFAHGDRGVDGDVEGEAHECGTCPLNEFGSSESGGKACKNMKHLFVLRPDDVMPLLVVLPPASIKAWQVYLTKAILLKRRKPYGTLTRIGIEKAKNAGGVEYSRATFTFGGELAPAQAAFCKALGEQLLPLVIDQATPVKPPVAVREEAF
jgi:hypothetical protein